MPGAARREGDLFRHLIERFAAFSGVSGVQPKVLIRDAPAARAFGKDEGGFARSFRGATHIVKFWDRSDYPELAANEFFCPKAAQRCGLEVPPFRLAEDGAALAIDRFDLRPDGRYRGVEDFCVLNARRTEEKYRGSYETAVMKRLADYVDTADLAAENETLFTLIALNCALRNGDAHLKNFAVVYERVLGQARLAPVYDLVTTSVYLPQDNMALTLDGTTRWPDARRLRRLGETRMIGTPARIRAILARIADAMADGGDPGVPEGASGVRGDRGADDGGVGGWDEGVAEGGTSLRAVLYSDQVITENDRVDRHLLRLMPGRPRIGYLPSAPDPDRRYFQEKVAYYGRYGITDLAYFPLDQPLPRETLDDLLPAMRSTSAAAARERFWPGCGRPT